jgi:hypothetical protein
MSNSLTINMAKLGLYGKTVRAPVKFGVYRECPICKNLTMSVGETEKQFIEKMKKQHRDAKKEEKRNDLPWQAR